MDDTSQTETLAADLLRGARAIADFTGLDPQTVYRLCAGGDPVITKKKGIGLVALKSDLRTRFVQAPSTPSAPGGSGQHQQETYHANSILQRSHQRRANASD